MQDDITQPKKNEVLDTQQVLSQSEASDNQQTSLSKPASTDEIKDKKSQLQYIFIALLLLALGAAVFGYVVGRNDKSDSEAETSLNVNESLKTTNQELHSDGLVT